MDAQGYSSPSIHIAALDEHTLPLQEPSYSEDSQQFPGAPHSSFQNGHQAPRSPSHVQEDDIDEEFATLSQKVPDIHMSRFSAVNLGGSEASQPVVFRPPAMPAAPSNSRHASFAPQLATTIHNTPESVKAAYNEATQPVSPAPSMPPPSNPSLHLHLNYTLTQATEAPFTEPSDDSQMPPFLARAASASRSTKAQPSTPGLDSLLAKVRQETTKVPTPQGTPIPMGAQNSANSLLYQQAPGEASPALSTSHAHIPSDRPRSPVYTQETPEIPEPAALSQPHAAYPFFSPPLVPAAQVKAEAKASLQAPTSSPVTPAPASHVHIEAPGTDAIERQSEPEERDMPAPKPVGRTRSFLNASDDLDTQKAPALDEETLRKLHPETHVKKKRETEPEEEQVRHDAKEKKKEEKDTAKAGGKKKGTKGKEKEKGKAEDRKKEEEKEKKHEQEKEPVKGSEKGNDKEKEKAEEVDEDLTTSAGGWTKVKKNSPSDLLLGTERDKGKEKVKQPETEKEPEKHAESEKESSQRGSQGKKGRGKRKHVAGEDEQDDQSDAARKEAESKKKVEVAKEEERRAAEKEERMKKKQEREREADEELEGVETVRPKAELAVDPSDPLYEAAVHADLRNKYGQVKTYSPRKKKEAEKKESERHSEETKAKKEQEPAKEADEEPEGARKETKEKANSQRGEEPGKKKEETTPRAALKDERKASRAIIEEKEVPRSRRGEITENMTEKELMRAAANALAESERARKERTKRKRNVSLASFP